MRYESQCAVSFKVDEEIRSLLPQLTDEEREILESSILKHGVTHPLAVWKEEGILLDGHNRYDIATKHGLVYTTIEVSCADREAALIWVDANQLGRRNLTPDQASLLRGRLYNRTKAGPGHPALEVEVTSSQFPKGTVNRAAKIIASKAGVSEKTVRSDAKFAAAVEVVKSVDPDIEKKVISGKGPSRKEVVARAAEIRGETPRASKAKPEREGIAPQGRRLPRKPIGVRLRRGTTTIVAGIELLCELETDPVEGTPLWNECIEELKKSRTLLTRFIRRGKKR